MGLSGMFIGEGIGIAIAVLGASLSLLGGALGISWLASKDLESVGRQPEASGSLLTHMIVASALIEGLTFAALGVAFYGIYAIRHIRTDYNKNVDQAKVKQEAAVVQPVLEKRG